MQSYRQEGDVRYTSVARSVLVFFLTLYLLAVCCLSLMEGFVCAETGPGSKGSLFPNVVLRSQLPEQDRAYLGISRKRSISLDDVHAKLIIVEVFNTYCVICLKNVPALNSIYSAIENDPRLKGTVKVVAVAVGNNLREVDAFRQEYKISYPVIEDPDFALHKALGNPKVPYTIIVAKKAGLSLVIDTHQGVLDSAGGLLTKIRGLL